jgi:hypothetical protein
MNIQDGKEGVRLSKTYFKYQEYILYTNNFYQSIQTCFSNKKYPITIQTRPTQIIKVYFLLENKFLGEFLRIIGVHN